MADRLEPELVVAGLVPATPIPLAVCFKLGVAGTSPATTRRESFYAIKCQT